MNHQIFFLEDDFDLIKRMAGIKYDSDNTEHRAIKDQLNQVYEKVEYWAKSVQMKMFESGRIHTRKSPIYQAQIFESYQWSKIYPSEKLANLKKIAYTVSISTENDFTVKIDTVNVSNSIRKIYERFRGDYYNSDIVHVYQKQEILGANWDKLIQTSCESIEKLSPYFEEFFTKLDLSETDNYGIIASIGWNENKWCQPPTENDLKTAKSYGYVSEENKMHECLNFAHELLPGEGDYYIGCTPNFNRLPKTTENVKVVFFSSRNPKGEILIVGFYAFPQIDNFQRKATHELYSMYNDGNIKSKKEHIVLFENPIPAHDERFLPIGKQLAKQSFNYINKSNVKAILDSSIEKNHGQTLLKKVAKMILPEVSPELNTQPLNKILYGPPGTGKTYNTILRAAQIITGKNITDYKKALEIFNENLGGRIEFITFHQNYSYEDFIQGLRPNVEKSENLAFQKIDGVFTQMAINALFEYYRLAKKKPSKLRNTSEADVDEIYLDFVEHLKKLENPEFKTATGSIVRISEFTKNDNIRLMHQSSSRPYLVSGKRLIKLFHVYPDIDLITNVAADIRGAIGGCNATMYWVMLFEFSEFVRDYQRDIEPEEIETDDDVDYDRKRKLLEKANLEELSAIKTEEVPSYVLIIDEINRANISRVFGELITLIEPDKRSHGAIPLRCTLPSGDEFIVPSNLYLIGTMNTADKSIALLDIALRRRFVFEAMYPLYDINDKPIPHSEILKKINEQIISRKGHDFQIGHAYVMNREESLAHIMNKKVIPLLLEYFMNDKKEVETILTNAGLTLKVNSWPIQIEE